MNALRLTLAATLATTASFLPGRAFAQAAGPAGLALDFGAPPAGAELFVEPPLHSVRRFIVIRLAENHLYLVDDGRAIWDAPVATGTGFRLQDANREWHFVTPRGVFRIQRKELDPVWIKPEWAFVEAGLPVPPLDSPLRRDSTMLGTTALYIGYELAIHGTSRPELVLRPDPDERRVSHGCIRLTNEDARTLYHLVEVGTPVLIY
ncbi:MAG TPA: L,D-transpeptidase [Longimicrobiales bacterium]